jgi:DNA-binding NarL/FixJ family response regulator
MITATNTSNTNVYCIASGHTSSEIERLLKESSGSKLIGSSNDAFTASYDLAKLDNPIVLIQFDPPRLDTIQIINQLREKFAGAKFIILLTEETHIWPALASKADAYLIWPTSWLPNAIDVVSKGGVWLGPYITQYLLQGDGHRLLHSVSSTLELPKSLEILSNREREVLKLLVDGMTNKQIAEALTLRIGTVKVHVNHILSKLQVEHRSQAIAKLTKLRLVN